MAFGGLLRDGEDSVAVAALQALGELADVRARALLQPRLQSPRPDGSVGRADLMAALALFRLHRNDPAPPTADARPERALALRLLATLSPSGDRLAVRSLFLRALVEDGDTPEPERLLYIKELEGLAAGSRLPVEDRLSLLKLLAADSNPVALTALERMARGSEEPAERLQDRTSVA
mgnify:CR=1 FL=1